MSTNSQEIVQQIRDHFESLLVCVTTFSTEKPRSAYDVELNLLRRLLEMGQMMLQLFFTDQSDHYRAPHFVTQTGHGLPYHSHKARSYWSVFGKIRFERAYYYQKGPTPKQIPPQETKPEGTATQKPQTKGEGYFALDAALNLPTTACSDLLAQWRGHLAVADPYHQVGQILAEILGQRLGFSTRALAEQIQAEGDLVGAFYEAAPVPRATPEASILVVQADGKGVPLVKKENPPPKIRLGKGEKAACKKEAIVTCVYTLVPWERTPQEVVDSLFKTKAEPYLTPRPARPQNKRWWATLEGKEAAMRFTRKQALARESPLITHRVALTDGSAPLQTQVQVQFPEFTLVLDLVHAAEYLWEGANALLGETDVGRTAWVKERTLQMLSGQTQELIAELRVLAGASETRAGARPVLARVANYYERNLPYMHYDLYLAAGWPVATGVIEGACRHLVKDRCELSGMRWTQSGAEELLHLRCVSENGDWEAFHEFLRRERLSEHYGREPQSKEEIEPIAPDRIASVPRLRLIDCQAA
jgi:hypothetical protein